MANLHPETITTPLPSIIHHQIPPEVTSAREYVQQLGEPALRFNRTVAEPVSRKIPYVHHAGGDPAVIAGG